MRPYELMLVIQPQLDAASVTGIVQSVSETIGRGGGDVSFAGQLSDKRGNVSATEDGWKTRRLAYLIGNYREAYYAVLRFMAPSESIDELERVVNLNDSVLRHLVLRLDEDAELIPPLIKAPTRGRGRGRERMGGDADGEVRESDEAGETADTAADAAPRSDSEQGDDAAPATAAVANEVVPADDTADEAPAASEPAEEAVAVVDAASPEAATEPEEPVAEVPAAEAEAGSEEKAEA